MRTQFQSGAEKGHWHATVGVEGTNTGEQTVRLLGPFTVNFDDELVNDDVIILDDALTPGALVTTVGFFESEEWDNGGSTFDVFVEIGSKSAVTGSNLATAGTAGSPYQERASGLTKRLPILVQPAPNNVLTFQIYSDGDAFTAGRADIYALIAEPA